MVWHQLTCLILGCLETLLHHFGIQTPPTAQIRTYLLWTRYCARYSSCYITCGTSLDLKVGEQGFPRFLSGNTVSHLHDRLNMLVQHQVAGTNLWSYIGCYVTFTKCIKFEYIRMLFLQVNCATPGAKGLDSPWGLFWRYRHRHGNCRHLLPPSHAPTQWEHWL